MPHNSLSEEGGLHPGAMAERFKKQKRLTLGTATIELVTKQTSKAAKRRVAVLAVWVGGPPLKPPAVSSGAASSPEDSSLQGQLAAPSSEGGEGVAVLRTHEGG